jgi:hypothetical protein
MRYMSETSPERRGRFRLRFPRVGCFLLALPCAPVLVFLAFLSIVSPPARADVAPQPFPADFMKGVSYESRQQGEFSSVDSERTLQEVVLPSGANWVAVIVTCYQETLQSTVIDCADPRTATDDDLRQAIHDAHDAGLKVMLKPHLDPRHLPDATSGRFHIDFQAGEAAWAAWFASYTRMMTHYAVLAQEMGADYLSIGCELGGTVGRAGQWRELIRQVRAAYEGPLTYAALTYVEPLKITWWDALDSIGVDAYFGLSLTKAPTIEQMQLGWAPNVSFLGWLAQHWNKPVILTEIGYMSMDGTNILPGFWSLEGEIDLQEQADAYQALFESLQGQPWWGGVFWWSLTTNPEQGGAQDYGYSFHDKPAENVLRRFFGA